MKRIEFKANIIIYNRIKLIKFLYLLTMKRNYI